MTLEASADQIYADCEHERINRHQLRLTSHLLSSAQSTNTINTTAEADPVQYVRSRFVDVLGREPDPAAHFYWSDLLIHCFEDSVCQDSAKQALNDYLSSSPAQTFSISGRITDLESAPLAGVTVTLSGSQSVATSTDSSGNYVFTNLPTSGRYVVTPASDDYDFDSATVHHTEWRSDCQLHHQTQDLFGEGNCQKWRQSFAGRGSCRFQDLRLGTMVTDSAGEYSFELQKGGDYVLTPAQGELHLWSSYNLRQRSERQRANRLHRDAQQTFDMPDVLLNPDGVPVAGVCGYVGRICKHTTTTASDGSYSFTES